MVINGLGVNFVLAMSSTRSLVSTSDDRGAPTRSRQLDQFNGDAHRYRWDRTFLMGKSQEAHIGGHRALSDRQLLQ